MRVGAAAWLAIFAMSGCSPACPDPACRAPVNVTRACRLSGRCTVDGAHTSCYPTCALRRDQVLVVPMEGFADELTGRRDLLVDYTGTSKPEPPPRPPNAHVTIDGIEGTSVPIEGSHAAYLLWHPFPAEPRNLEVSSSDGGAVGVADLQLLFSSRTCALVHRDECFP